MLVLSPFSRGGHVASQVFDHTSQLRFLEERFGVKAPNISAWRRKDGGRPHLGAAPGRGRHVGAHAAQHVEGPDGQRHGAGVHGGRPSWRWRPPAPCRCTPSRRSSRCPARRRPDVRGRTRARDHRRPERDAALGKIEHRGRAGGILRCGRAVAQPGRRRVGGGDPRAVAARHRAAPGRERPDLEDAVVALFDALYACVRGVQLCRAQRGGRRRPPRRLLEAAGHPVEGGPGPAGPGRPTSSACAARWR